jgi:hypothetical protein
VLRRWIRHLVAPAVANPIATPAGYTAFDAEYEERDGHRIWSQEFAKGNGEIRRSETSSLGGNLQRVVITHLTASSVGTQPTTDPWDPDGTLVTTEKEDRDGHRVWTAAWIKGDASVGEVFSSVRKHNRGKLVLYHITQLGAAPAAPAATIGGTIVLIEDNSRREDGYAIYDRIWAEGKGVIGKRTQPRDGGLRLETWESLGDGYDDSFMKPGGVLMAKDHDDLDGATRWTVTCMQKNNGTDPATGTALEWQDFVEFTYPGRAKIYYKEGSYLAITRRAYNVFLSPPVASLILGTHKVSYTTDPDELETLAETLWNPVGSATLFGFWVENGTGSPTDHVEALRGYRSVDDTEVTVTAGGSGLDRSILGRTVQPSTAVNKLQVTGGPEAPDGNTYTIGKPRLEPAFVAFDGTQYFRKTIVEATIPAQEALPV